MRYRGLLEQGMQLLLLLLDATPGQHLRGHLMGKGGDAYHFPILAQRLVGEGEIQLLRRAGGLGKEQR